MSMFGAGLTVARLDGAPLKEEERDRVRDVIEAQASKHGISFTYQDPSEPMCEIQWEEDDGSCLFSTGASYAYKILDPDEAEEGFDADLALAQELQKHVEAEIGHTYRFEAGVHEY